MMAARQISVFPKATPGAKVFRSGAARFFGWAWMVFAAANLVDLGWRGRDSASLVAAAVMLLGCGIAYAVALRPRIIADGEAVHLHNLLRDVRIPWRAVERVEGGDAVYVHAGGRRFRAFVLQTSPRARAKFERKAQREDSRLPDAVADYVRGRTPTDFAAEQVSELADAHGPKKDGADTGGAAPEAGGAAGPVESWAWPAIIALAVPGAAFVLALGVAVR